MFGQDASALRLSITGACAASDAAIFMIAAPVHAQERGVQPTQPGQPPAQTLQSGRLTPSQLELSKIIWSIVAAVDHANRSGNYSVLRDISAQAFQSNYNPARLTEVFAGLRKSKIDLSNVLLVPPTYYQAPQMVREDLFRVKGIFQLRPTSIQFDMLMQWEQGRWKLAGIDLQPVDTAARQASQSTGPMTGAPRQ